MLLFLYNYNLTHYGSRNFTCLQTKVDCSGDPPLNDLDGPFTFRDISSYGIVPGTVCSVTGCFLTEGEDLVLTIPTNCTLQGKHKQLSQCFGTYIILYLIYLRIRRLLLLIF